jgi:ubiquinone/menaquinone biosynthesis C-methylase UbiE
MDQPNETSPEESLPLRLWAMINSNWPTQALAVAAHLGLPDLLAGGPQTSASLAQATGAHAPSLHRLLRALVTLDIVRERDDGAFDLRPMGALLRRDAAPSLRAWAIFWGRYQWQEWGQLLDSVKTGHSARQLLTGTDGPRYWEQHPEEAAVFNQAMVDLTQLIAPAVVQAYDFTGVRRIIDVGGGYGELLVAILTAHPEACGVLFDVPRVIEHARPRLARADLAHRCEYVAGDFFTAVPGGGDAYVLKSVIHNWNDERSAVILANCRRAMPAGATLLLVERLMPERLGVSAADQEHARGDLNRLIASGLTGNAAKERTAAEFRVLLESAGFRLARIVPVGGEFSVIEATTAE